MAGNKMDKLENFDEIERELKAAKDALKRELEVMHAPSEIEAKLMAAFEQHFPKKKWYQRLMPSQWQLAGGVLASVFAAMIVFHQLDVKQFGGSAQPGAYTSQQAGSNAYEDIPFVAINSGETILQQDSMRIVQAQVPQTVLASMGVSVDPQTAGEYANAEMLVGANDEPLAVRFLPNDLAIR
jgi:hypothetical protein